MFFTKDEKMASLEKRLNDLEKRMDKSFGQTNDSFSTLRDVMLKMQKENGELKKDRDYLLERYKDVLRKLDLPQKIIGPMKNEIRENAQLVRDIMLEDLDIEPKSKNIDDLFEIVMQKKKISPKSAARMMNVPESQVSYWANKLQKQGLVDVGKDIVFRNAKVAR